MTNLHQTVRSWPRTLGRFFSEPPRRTENDSYLLALAVQRFCRHADRIAGERLPVAALLADAGEVGHVADVIEDIEVDLGAEMATLGAYLREIEVDVPALSSR